MIAIQTKNPSIMLSINEFENYMWMYGKSYYNNYKDENKINFIQL